MKNNLRLFLLLFFLFISFSGRSQVITFPVYIDNSSGDDAFDGKSPEKAWKSLTKINSEEFGPGAQLLFKAGGHWEGSLSLKGSGSAEEPIIISKYGEGSKPTLRAVNSSQTIFLYNLQYWDIKNIRVTNYQDNSGRRRGIYVVGNDIGVLNHLHFINIEVDSVNSEVESFDSRYYGGIFFKAQGNSTPTYFNDVLIDSCYIHDLGRTGISNDSDWAIRSKNSTFGDFVGTDGNGIDQTDNWTPNTNFIVRNCRFERIGGNGLIIRVAKNALVENNIFDYCGMTISGNAAFCFNTDSTIFQYNEASHTVYNDGDTDARGLDSDFRSKYTIIQYNYLHHNGLGAVVATGGSGEPVWWERFNDSTIIRYNLFLDNENEIIATSGKITNMLVYNNVIYTSAGLDNVKIIRDASWGGASIIGARYYNNIFFHLGSKPTFSYGNGEDVVFENNIYFGNHADNEPDDPAKIVTNPLFSNHSDPVEGFKLRENSPAIGTGKLLPSLLPANDYFGNPLPSDGPINIGMYQQPAEGPVTGIGHLTPARDMILYPMPARNFLNVQLPEHPLKDKPAIQIISMTGKMKTIDENLLKINGNQANIDLSQANLSTGMYILRITYLNKLYSAKFVIQE